jgi:hypothetical protein
MNMMIIIIMNMMIMMVMMMMMIIIIIISKSKGDNSNDWSDSDYFQSFRKYVTYQETMTLRNYRKQPYWALHTYFGKC